MFAHRLGLALGKTLGEINAMPYAEYHSWKTYYKLEPFGWQDREYRTGYLAMAIHNTHAKKAKPTSDFMRDPEQAVKEHVNQAKAREKWRTASREEKARMLRQSFSGMGVKAKVKK